MRIQNKSPLGPTSGQRKPKHNKHHFADLRAAAQRGRLLSALQLGPVTTLDARRKLDILHPAMRVLELRRRGHRIATIWTLQETDARVRHRVARYVLNLSKGLL